MAPTVRFDDPAGQYRPAGLESLPDDLQPEFVQAGEGGQVRAGEGSVAHVEVFRLGGVRTSMIGRSRRIPGHRLGQRADGYPDQATVDCELLGGARARTSTEGRTGMILSSLGRRTRW